MPRKKIAKLPDKNLQKVIDSATRAVRYGLSAPSSEKLDRIRKYTQIQKNLYLETYWSLIALTPDFAIRKARRAAYTALNKGRLCPTKEELLQKYSPVQTEAYLKVYSDTAKTNQELMLRRARIAGQQAASQGNTLMTEEELKQKRNYSVEEVQAYIQGYQQSCIHVRTSRKSQLTGMRAALLGTKNPDKQELVNKGLSDIQADAYIKAYHESVGTVDEQLLRKARTAGRCAFSKKVKEPTLQKLLKRGYSDTQALAYLEAYQKAKQRKENQQTKNTIYLPQDDFLSVQTPFSNNNSICNDETSEYMAILDDILAEPNEMVDDNTIFHFQQQLTTSWNELSSRTESNIDFSESVLSVSKLPKMCVR